MVVSSLETPFGAIGVTVNGKSYEFDCREEIYSYQNDKNDPFVNVKCIDVDISTFGVGDIIHCGFAQNILKFSDSDERSQLLYVENEVLELQLCGYEPGYHEAEAEYHSYAWCSGDGRGFEYIIERDPKRYKDSSLKQANVITLAVAWVEKAKYAAPSLSLFITLTIPIG